MDVTSVIVTLPSLSTSPTKSDSGSVGGILDAIGMEHKVEMSRKVQSNREKCRF